MAVNEYDCQFEINREFYDKSVDPQMIMAMVTLMDREIISENDIFSKLKSAGLVDPERTIEDIKQERGDANPLIWGHDHGLQLQQTKIKNNKFNWQIYRQKWKKYKRILCQPLIKK